MKKYLIIMLIALVVCLCLGFIGYSYNLGEIQIKLVGGKSSADNKQLKYHFVLIAQDMGDSFWQSVETGAGDAAKKYSAAIEFNGSMINNESEELDDLSIAIASHVDGIIVYVTNESDFTPLIDKAVGDGIHVITIESDDKGSIRDAFVGPNSYEAGNDEGKLIAEASSGDSNVAMIIGGNYADNNGAKIDLLSGFSDSIRGNSGIRLETTVQVPDSGYFAAENIIRNILNEYPDVNTVVSTGADDTMEIHQVLNDLNKEGRITLIGYGNTLQLRNYIKNGDVFGSIYEDSENTGYFSVESLVRCLGGQKLQSFIDTGVYTVARSNLESFSLGT